MATCPGEELVARELTGWKAMHAPFPWAGTPATFYTLAHAPAKCKRKKALDPREGVPFWPEGAVRGARMCYNGRTFPIFHARASMSPGE